MMRGEYGTRRQRAVELMNLLTAGPCIGVPTDGAVIACREAERECRLWIDTWITPLVRSLCKEVKEVAETDRK